MGISGGRPYATVYAYKIPERLTMTAIVCGMGPSEAPGSIEGKAWTFPGKSSVMRRLILMLTSMGMRKKPDRIQSQMIDTLKGPDKALFLDKPELAKKIIDSWQEAFRSAATLPVPFRNAALPSLKMKGTFPYLINTCERFYASWLPKQRNCVPSFK